MNKEQGTMTKKTDAPLPANMFEEDAAKGLGNIRQQDLALPFLKILAQLSPEVNERDGKYQLLKWDKQERKYYPIKINLHEKGEINE